MRRKLLSIICISMLLSQGCSRTERVNVSESSGVESSAEVSSEAVISTMETENETTTKEAETDTEEYKVIHTLYDWEYYSKLLDEATAEQKAKIEELENNGNNPANWYPKKVMSILGLIPEDCPRITKEQAQKILDEMQEKKAYIGDQFYNIEMLQELFNEYAGAADYDGGNNRRVIYYLDDKNSAFIEMTLDVVLYHKSEDDIGEYMGAPYNIYESKPDEKKQPEDFYVPGVDLFGKTSYSKEELWEACYTHADDEQKTEMDKLKVQYGDDVACYIRDYASLFIDPERVSRVTMANVKYVYTTPYYAGYSKWKKCVSFKEYIDHFVCGPDYCGIDKKDGVYKAIYYTDDERNEWFEFTTDNIVYVSKTGEREVLYTY